MSGGLAVACWAAKGEVQTPVRAEIWIEISVPCAPYSAFGTTSQWIGLPESVAGASIPSEAMMHLPVFLIFPLFSRNFSGFVENHPNFSFSPRNFRFSSAKISDGLSPYFSCFNTFPYFAKFFFSPTFPNFYLTRIHDPQISNQIDAAES